MRRIFFELLLMIMYSASSFCSEGNGGLLLPYVSTAELRSMPASMPFSETIAMADWFDTKGQLIFVGLNDDDKPRWQMKIDTNDVIYDIERHHDNPRLNGVRFCCDHVTMYMYFDNSGVESRGISIHPQTAQFLQSTWNKTDNIHFICRSIKKSMARSEDDHIIRPGRKSDNVVLEKQRYIVHATDLYDALQNFLHEKSGNGLPECYTKIMVPYERNLEVTEQEVDIMNARLLTQKDMIFEAIGIGANRRWKIASDEKAPTCCEFINLKDRITLSSDDYGNRVMGLRYSNSIRLDTIIYEFLCCACSERKSIFFIDMFECEKFYEVLSSMLREALMEFKSKYNIASEKTGGSCIVC